MQEKCPVCKNNIKVNDSTCSICGFKDLHREFISIEDAKLWTQEIVEPYKKKYEEIKISNQHILQLHNSVSYNSTDFDEDSREEEQENIAIEEVNIIQREKGKTFRRRVYKIFIIVILSCIIIVASTIGIKYMIKNYKFKKTMEAINENNSFETTEVFWDVNQLKDSNSLNVLLADSGTTFGLRTNGTVIATGDNYNGECDIYNWRNITKLAISISHTVGLKADGTVVAVGDNSVGQCDVSNWHDIIDISVSEGNTIGLKADGTVVAIGYNGNGECEVGNWNNIISISSGVYHTVGLKSDGSVVAAGTNYEGICDVSDWKNIVAVSANELHTVGLRKDGTVVATGDNGDASGDIIAMGYEDLGRCAVDDWNNITSISSSKFHTSGIKADGTVMVTGRNNYGQCDVENWTDIIKICNSWRHTVGLKKDGTVVAIGDNRNGQCNVSNWKDIIAISAGDEHTVGLKSDGTVVATGQNFYGECNTTEWDLIK